MELVGLGGSEMDRQAGGGAFSAEPAACLPSKGQAFATECGQAYVKQAESRTGERKRVLA